MTELTCWPLDNKQYTAVALGAAYAARSRGLLTAESFSLTTNGDNTVTLAKGLGCLHVSDFWACFPYALAETLVQFEDADGVYPRKDVVVLGYDKNANQAGLYVRTGLAAASPVMPTIRRDNDYDEIYLYCVNRPTGATSITPDNVEDLRLNATYCGLMRDTIDAIDTSVMQASFAEFLGKIEQELDQLNAGTETMLKTQYDPQGLGTDIYAYAGAVAPLYTATYLLDGWVATSKNGYNWQQTVTLAPDGEAPAMNADSVFLTVGGFLPTGVASTDDALADSMACINAGYTTCGNGTVTTLVVDKPNTDISVRWSIRPKGIGSGGDAGGGSGGGIHIDDIYPVGSIYMNVNATSPSTLFGGTWERINGGFLVAADSNHPAGSTGGRSAVTLTAQNIPQMTGYLGYSDGGYVPRNGEARSVIKHQDNGGDAIDGTDKSGYLSDRVPDGYYGSPLVRMGTASPSSISIEPPYLAVYMWRRTA